MRTYFLLTAVAVSTDTVSGNRRCLIFTEEVSQTVAMTLDKNGKGILATITDLMDCPLIVAISEEEERDNAVK